MPIEDLPPQSPSDAPAPAHPNAPQSPMGQLGVFAVLGAAARVVPVPWLPNALAERLRGALVQDIAARHGVALTPGARSTLASPVGAKQGHSPWSEALAYLGRRLFARFGPLSALLPARAAIETYVLGYLLDHYLAVVPHGSQLETREARHVRRAIERAVMHVVSVDGRLAWLPMPVPPHESRDELTRLVDRVLCTATLAPAWLLRRLETAFDQALTEP
jgi:hypothetical protein